MIGLDGCEPSIADSMAAAGRLPTHARLMREAARHQLDHGGARRTGLAWEHVATGLDPDLAERWAAVDFDAATYDVRQRSTNLAPFVSGLDARTVVVDPPYFDLPKTNARGLVGWGAHDPGVPTCSQPVELAEEIRARFGEYCAGPWIYGFVWPSPEKAGAMAEALPRAVDQRAALAQWMLAERFPDWDIGLVVVSEYHSAIEALWHGIDPSHPLHGLPSAQAAKAGVEGVYEAGDRLVGGLMRAFPDAVCVVFNLHGMGPNNSDNASMVLLAELMYRRAFGRPFMRQRAWPLNERGVPLLREDQIWRREIGRLFDEADPMAALANAAKRAFFSNKSKPTGQPSLSWMPATRYQKFWPQMRAFALPSFYDGRIRINLRGREAQGLVEPSEYEAERQACIDMLHACRDPVTGQPAVERVEKRAGDPMTAKESEADLIVIWTMAPPLGLEHDELGVMGPLPYRRTGGHTGGPGFAYFHGPGIAAGDFGTRSAFDVVPSVLGLLEAGRGERLSGRPVELNLA
jgi:predicted AlkP superfamily phosphohydrolase/phosphomutase